MLEKEEKQVCEECSRPQRTAAAEAQFPFYFRRGAGRRGSNIKISDFLVKKRPSSTIFETKTSMFKTSRKTGSC